MITQEYMDYLRSDTWQQKRSERLRIDKYRCQICNKPFNLDVHHMSYPAELGTENVYTDLITLCRDCHEDIERQKREYDPQMEWKKKSQANLAALRDVIMKKRLNDLSAGGMRDYCNQETIRADFGGECEKIGISYVMRVQEYFRNRRYEIILDMMNRGYTPQQIIKRTCFSRNMVNKVFDKPLQAKTLIEREEFRND